MWVVLPERGETDLCDECASGAWVLINLHEMHTKPEPAGTRREEWHLSLVGKVRLDVLWALQGL